MDEWIFKYIRQNKYITNEYPNLFATEKIHNSQSNEYIHLNIFQYILNFKYLTQTGPKPFQNQNKLLRIIFPLRKKIYMCRGQGLFFGKIFMKNTKFLEYALVKKKVDLNSKYVPPPLYIRDVVLTCRELLCSDFFLFTVLNNGLHAAHCTLHTANSTLLHPAAHCTLHTT